MEISDNMNCPICFEIPRREVYQCVNGHTVCHDCCMKLSKCPQCRLPYDSVKIRNRALESILDRVKLDCVYKSKGCNASLSRQNISSHSENCLFGGIKFNLCQQLGFSCGYAVNSNKVPEARKHFVDHHKCDVLSTAKMRFALMSVPKNCKPPHTSRWMWKPNVVDIYGKTFLVFPNHHPKEGFLSFHFLALNDAADIWNFKEFQGEFHIKAKIADGLFPDLVWTTPPTHIRQAEVTLRTPIFRFPHQLWMDYSNIGDVFIYFTISKVEIE